RFSQDAVVRRGDFGRADLVSHEALGRVGRLLGEGGRDCEPGIKPERGRHGGRNHEVATRQIEHGSSPRGRSKAPHGSRAPTGPRLGGCAVYSPYSPGAERIVRPSPVGGRTLAGCQWAVPPRSLRLGGGGDREGERNLMELSNSPPPQPFPAGEGGEQTERAAEHGHIGLNARSSSTSMSMGSPFLNA